MSKPTIRVEQVHGADPWEFSVSVRGARKETRHAVVLCRATLEQLASSDTPPERLVLAAFAFLLDRESNESILERFDVTVIGRYFPEFEREIAGYLAQA